MPAVASAQDVSDQIVIKRTAHLSAAQNADVRADADVSLVANLPITDVQVVSADDGDRRRALEALRSDPRVEWADADVVRYATGTDPIFSLQWGLSNTGQAVKNRAGTAGDDISALAAWGMSRGAGITVGVVDSGAQLDHPDLQRSFPATTTSIATRFPPTAPATARRCPASSPPPTTPSA